MPNVMVALQNIGGALSSDGFLVPLATIYLHDGGYVSFCLPVCLFAKFGGKFRNTVDYNYR